jgi:hypothetical protein
LPMQGSELTAISDILDKVKSGGMEVATAAALISMAVPTQPPQAILQLVQANAPKPLPGQDILPPAEVPKNQP